MAGVVVLDVADEIRHRLGEPTVSVLGRRFGPGGTCLSCQRHLGPEPLSVRAYCDDRQIITLVAYHAECAASAWLDVEPGLLPRDGTWAAAVTSTPLPVAARRWLRWLPRSPAREQVMPLMLVHPCLEMSCVRQVSAGETVNADLEAYARLGFNDPGTLARTHPLTPAGQARLEMRGTDLSLSATAGDGAWFAAAPEPAASLVQARGGVLIGLTCDRDPAQLVNDIRCLEYALGNGEILLAWAPLSEAQDESGQPQHQ